jgi:hypothetical protein
MRHWCISLVGSLVCFSALMAAEAKAQSRQDQTVPLGSRFGQNTELQRIRNSMTVRTAPTVASTSRVTGGLARRALSAPQPNSKPFSNVQRQPTLSPYLNLERDGGDSLGGLPNYFTFVRPALEQEQVNRRQQREIQDLNRQVETVNRQLIYGQMGESMVRPTGHPTAFMNHSHFFTFPGR